MKDGDGDEEVVGDSVALELRAGVDDGVGEVVSETLEVGVMVAAKKEYKCDKSTYSYFIIEM